jgi:toxin-antitoxin system PIN domain toxin
MPRSKIFLPDVNVWVALATRRHAHSAACANWLTSLQQAEIIFCRVTQMGLLRLLTNESVMGRDVLSSRDAWRVYARILTDDRMAFAPEPFTFEGEWRKLTTSDRPTPKIWTDAYLAAFARSAEMRLVTLDRAVLALDPNALLLS